MAMVKNFAVELLGTNWAHLVLLAIEMTDVDMTASQATDAYTHFTCAFSKIGGDATELSSILITDMSRTAQELMTEMSNVEHLIDNTDDQDEVACLQETLTTLTYAVLIAKQLSVILEIKLSELLVNLEVELSEGLGQ